MRGSHNKVQQYLDREELDEKRLEEFIRQEVAINMIYFDPAQRKL